MLKLTSVKAEYGSLTTTAVNTLHHKFNAFKGDTVTVKIEHEVIVSALQLERILKNKSRRVKIAMFEYFIEKEA